MSFHREPIGLKAPSGVSKKLRNFARGKTCTLRVTGVCNGDAETTVHAHLRYFGWAGIAQKPVDFLGIHACSACHDALDRRSTEHSLIGFEDILRALGETQMRLHRAGILRME